MNNGNTWKKYIRDRVENMIITAVFITVLLIDIRVTVPIIMVMSLFFLYIQWAIRGALVGTAFGLLIVLIISGITQEGNFIVIVAPYGALLGAVMGFYIGGLAGTFFRGPSNKFVAKTFAKWQKKQDSLAVGLNLVILVFVKYTMIHT